MSDHQTPRIGLEPGDRCPQCGNTMPAGALAGLCPGCLLKEAFDTDPGKSGAGIPFKPPPLEEIKGLFPQLEILGWIGAGGMGAVYKARQPALDRVVALKVLPQHGAPGVNFAERFNREARALARLSHPNIVAVHEFGQVRGLYFFVMEFVDGVNLRQLQKAGRLSPREALQIIPQICDALQYAHDEGVIHRDIKPENVLVDRKGRVKIADFGLAKILGLESEALRLTAEGQVMGTPHYMAPEQVERPLAVDHRADIYSLGVVLYEMLTGDLPLGKFAPPSRKVQVDVRLDEVVLRALENDPQRRYQQASEVKSKVEIIARTNAAATASESISFAPPHGTTGASPRRYHRWAGFPVVIERDGRRAVHWKGALAALASALGLVALGFLVVWWLTGEAHHSKRNINVCLNLAVVVVVWGVAQTLRRARIDAREEPARGPGGTVMLAPPRARWTVSHAALAGILIFVVVWCVVIERMTNLRVDQVAGVDPSTGAWAAQLPENGKVELAAVSGMNPAPNGWWRPDGSPITNELYEVEGLGELSGNRIRRQHFILRLADLPDGASGPYLEFDAADQVTGGNRIFMDGKPMLGGWTYYVAFPDSTEHATMRVGLGLAPWRTFLVHEQFKQPMSHAWHPEDRRWEVTIHRVSEENGHAQVTLMMGRVSRDWKIKLVAIGINGLEQAYSDIVTTPTQSGLASTYTFRGMRLEAVREFKIQTRPVYWIEFRHVRLQPSRPVPLGVPATFGPVREQTFSALIDFDTGRLGDYPSGAPNQNPLVGIGENVLWLQEQGFDAEAGGAELRPVDMIFAALNPGDWDNLTAAQLKQRLYEGQFKPRALKELKQGDFPSTYGFRTREGGRGMLQLMRFSEEGVGATVRYKLIQESRP